jgi:pimeloyl-ACP methyl ester carboxylesterase
MMTHVVLQGRERLLEGLPVVERRLDLAGISTPILEGGKGPPLVLLHGPGEHALKWQRVLAGLVRRHRVIAPDLPGHGASAVTHGTLDADRVLRWLGELLEETSPGPATVVGHVISGPIAARLAASRHRRVARLVLVDSLGLVPFQPSPEFGEALGAFLAAPDETTFAGLWRYCAHDVDRLRRDLGERWDTFINYSLERVRSPEGSRALHAVMEHFGLPAMPASELQRIEIPVALIWGRHDLATSLSVAEAASARYGWPLYIVEGAGDDPGLEQPEGFVAALDAALRDTG